MNTIEVVCTAKPPGIASPISVYYEIVAEPITFDQAEAHCALGGQLCVMKDGAVWQVFDDGIGPTFAGLWANCTFHIIVGGS
jgi:hypothetical protein